MAHATGKETHVPVAIEADLSALSEHDLETLSLLAEAAHVADRIYLQQMRHEPVLPGTVFTLPKEPYAFPADATKQEIDAFLEDNPEARDDIMDPFTVVIRTEAGFAAVPYAQAYAEDCERLAALLAVAGTRVSQPYMRDYLLKRSLAFETSKFRESDIAWIQANDSPFELIIGPYESYADKLYGVKRTFEAILGIVRVEETRQAGMFQNQLQGFDSLLGSIYDYETSPTLTPMVVMDEVTASGESLYEYVPIACNLPNDTDIHQEVGSKKVFMHNVMQAKFRVLTLPIAERVLSSELLQRVDFYALLLFVIGHEGSHGLSFHFTGEDFGTEHSALEECKADVFGILFLYYLVDEGVLEAEIAEKAVIGHLADILRQIRFGLEEAHAIGGLVQYNWLQRHGVLKITSDELSFNPTLCRTAFGRLGDELYRVCKAKNTEVTQTFLTEWGSIPPSLPALIEKLTDLPVDIDPIFSV